MRCLSVIFSRWLFLIALISLSACTTHPPKDADWPKDMPSRSYFVDCFKADLENQESGQTQEEYLMWVVRFYKGWELYRNGWSRVTEDAALAAKDPEMATQVTLQMQNAGKAISCEWAKNKKSRRVLTRHVAVWGNALLESIRRNQELDLIDRVNIDVRALVANQLDINSIKPDRYFPPDKDDVFGP